MKPHGFYRPLSLHVFLLLVLAVVPLHTLADTDTDGDGIPDAVDNCPARPNPDQGRPVLISEPLIGIGDVTAFALAPDSRHAVYQARRGVPYEVFAALTDGSGAVRLDVPSQTGSVPPHLDVDFALDRPVIRFVTDLLSAPFDGSPATPLNPLGSTASRHVVSPDGSTVFFLLGPGNLELARVPSAGGTATVLTPGADVEDFRSDPNGERVLYRATPDGTPELFVVPAGGGAPATLNGPLVGGGEVYGPGYCTTPDGLLVLYLASQEVATDIELYSVPVTGGATTRLSPPDSSRVYAQGDDPVKPTADDGQVVFGITDAVGGGVLYSSNVEGGFAVPLSAPLHGRVRFDTFAVDPGGSRAVYLARDDVTELYSVPVEGGAVTRLNGELVDVGPCVDIVEPFGGVCAQGSPPDVCFGDEECRGNVGGVASRPFRISPDGHRVVYVADQEQLGVVELFSVPTAGGTAVRLNGPLAGGGQVLDFRIDPGSRLVVYRAEQDTNGVPELYSVPIAGGSSVKLNDPLPAHGEVSDAVALTADGRRAVYAGEQRAANVVELFSVALDADLDGAPDTCDACLGTFDPAQTNDDQDDFGQACDCEDLDESVFPGAPEINDGQDNQCPGDEGFGLADEIGTASEFFSDDPNTCAWSPQIGATGYEVARSTSADFSTDCVVFPTTVPQLEDTGHPLASQVFYYLVRAASPFVGTWGADSSGQERPGC